uniref:Uncharacterized protein n=1 Tax=Strigamia maritima TaxID=126957 RepID=T1IUJ2_STRMM
MTSVANGAVDFTAEEKRTEKPYDWTSFIKKRTVTNTASSREKIEKKSSQNSLKSDGEHSIYNADGPSLSVTRLMNGTRSIAVANNQSNEATNYLSIPVKTSSESCRTRDSLNPNSIVCQCTTPEFKVPRNLPKSQMGEPESGVVHRDLFYSIAIVVICVAMAFLVLRRIFFLV